MSQITWRNIDAPNLTGAISGIDIASRTLDRAVQSFTGIADSNAAQIQKNIQSLDDQGQAAILQQMSAFSTPEELTAAIQAGTFDDVMAGMTGSAQATAQTRITNRSDTLLDQSIRNRDLELREDEQDLKELHFTTVTKPAADASLAAIQRDIRNTEAANAVISAANPTRARAELAESIKGIQNQFRETNPELYDEDGNLVRERVTDQAIMEKLEADYAALHVSDSLRVQSYLTRLAETVDVGSPQFVETKSLLDKVHQLRTENTAYSQNQIKQFANNWKATNKAHNNPYIEHDEMVASGKSLHQTLVDEGIIDEIMKNADKYPSSLITGIQKHALKGTVRVNGVDIPITPSMFRIAAAKGADAYTLAPNDTFEDALVDLAKQVIGKDPDMPTLIEQRDAYRTAMNAERAKHSGDPHIAVAQNRDYWAQMRAINKERAQKTANAENGSSSSDGSTLDSVVRDTLANNRSPFGSTNSNVGRFLKENGGQIEKLSESAIPKMTEAEMRVFQTLLIGGASLTGRLAKSKRQEMVAFLNGINSR